MSQHGIPTPAPILPVLGPSKCDPKEPLDPCLIPPQLDVEEYRAVESQARHEIGLIEHQAREKARLHYPLEPLPRDLSNKRSVQRTRFARKEVDRILTEKIREKDKRNRELDRLIEIEKQKYLRRKKQREEERKLPHPQPDLVHVEHETPEHIMQEFIAQIGAEYADPSNITEQPLERPDPDTDFKEQYADLTHAFLDFHDTTDRENDDFPGCEPILDSSLLDPVVDLSEELERSFLLGEDEPHEEDAENQHVDNQGAVNEDAVNEEPDNEEFENPAHQDVF